MSYYPPAPPKKRSPVRLLLIIAGVCVLGLVLFVSCVAALFGGDETSAAPAPTVTETVVAPTATVTASAKPKAAVTVTAKPKPTVTVTVTAKPKPKPKPTRRSVYYANCDAVRAAGADPIYEGEPGYSRRLDRDGDGVGCE